MGAIGSVALGCSITVGRFIGPVPNYTPLRDKAGGSQETYARSGKSLYSPIFNEGTNVLLVQQYPGKPDDDSYSYQFRYVYLWLCYESIEFIRYPIREIFLLESEAEKRPK